jgi:hypothetical protein
MDIDRAATCPNGHVNQTALRFIGDCWAQVVNEVSVDGQAIDDNISSGNVARSASIGAIAQRAVDSGGS